VIINILSLKEFSGNLFGLGLLQIMNIPSFTIIIQKSKEKTNWINDKLVIKMHYGLSVQRFH
jgi:hypothetical protein